TYLQAIERAGAVPVVLPPCVSDLESLLARLDGICISGGPDLDPEAYGARERHAELGPTEPSLDAFELALARAAPRRSTSPAAARCTSTWRATARARRAARPRTRSRCWRARVSPR